ncbi:MAG: IS3 family transposase [Spiroplasma sp.]
MFRRDNSINNISCESWFSRFKSKVIYHISRSKLKPNDVKNSVDNYIEFYNFVRPIKKISAMSPIEYFLSNYLFFKCLFFINIIIFLLNNHQ